MDEIYMEYDHIALKVNLVCMFVFFLPFCKGKKAIPIKIKVKKKI